MKVKTGNSLDNSGCFKGGCPEVFLKISVLEFSWNLHENVWEGVQYLESWRHQDLRTSSEKQLFYGALWESSCFDSAAKLLKPVAYSKHCKTSQMEHFAKIVHGFQQVIIFAKRSILNVWLGPEYAFGN